MQTAYFLKRNILLKLDLHTNCKQSSTFQQFCTKQSHRMTGTAKPWLSTEYTYMIFEW